MVKPMQELDGFLIQPEKNCVAQLQNFGQHKHRVPFCDPLVIDRLPKAITNDFKEALWQMETRRDQNAEDQGQVLAKMSETLSKMASSINDHDKTVNDKVVTALGRIEEQTRPRSQVNRPK